MNMSSIKVAKKWIKKTKRLITKNIFNLSGWTTDRKLVIIESDDWGSIRIPSKKVHDYLLKKGDKLDSDPFTRYDSLASEKDLSLLFDVLTKYKDCKGKNPVITANCVVANPDFAKIRASGLEEYYYEPFTDTLKKYPEHTGSFNRWLDGIKHGIFFPQLHCREHMNVTRWMKHLREGKSDVIEAFNNEMISTGNSFTPVNRFAYMDAFNYDSEKELDKLKGILSEGAKLFERIFGYSSKSFIAPCYIWSDALEEEMDQNGIKYIQGNRIQLIPQEKEGTKTFTKKRHYFGQANRLGQLYLIRNSPFEPSLNPKVDWIDHCMFDIGTAFRWKKPATISTHRLNYVGYINEENREKNLGLLSNLLSVIIKKWPDVEFITTVELGQLMDKSDGAV